MECLTGPFFTLLCFGGLLIIGLAFVSPFEALGWWSGWSERQVEPEAIADNPHVEKEDLPEADHHVVYLTGIGGFSGEWLGDREIHFVDTLAERLPGETIVVRDVFPFSVTNNPLSGERQLAKLWQWIHARQVKNPMDVFTFIIVLRNLFQVAISSDPRYGPINNVGVASAIGESLLQKGYRPDSGKPITLFGYSGGAQIAVAVARYLHKAFEAPIRVFTFGGVMGDDPGMENVDHLYQLIGGKDFFPKVGAVAFPGRWPILKYSTWNKALADDRITVFDAGPDTIHTGPTDYFSPTAILENGKSHLDNSLDFIVGIMSDTDTAAEGVLPETARTKSNYYRYQQLPFLRPDYYPIEQSVSSELYRPIANWMGRLILPLPEQRKKIKGVLFEVYHTDEAHQHLVGQTVELRYSHDPRIQKRVWAVTRDIYFDQRAEESRREGLIHPDRLDKWQLVSPLESLAGARPNDDVIVSLHGPEVEEVSGLVCLYVSQEPTQISGRFYALVKFLGPEESDNPAEVKQRVAHFNRDTGQFDGPEEVVSLPHIMANVFDINPSTSHEIENSAMNAAGWYIYGAQDHDRVFVVQSLAPRALFRLEPEQVVLGDKEAKTYLKKQAWENAGAHKGKIQSVLLSPRAEDAEAAVSEWQEGDEALIASVYGGITGRKQEPYAVMGRYYFGHFSYGTARVIREPLSGELRFDIVYHQVYTNNIDGLIPGRLHWSRYMGDRQWGFLGFRPVADILLKLDAFCEPYDLAWGSGSALEAVAETLEIMTARYRTGDGTGGTYVAASNNCAQDSNQALYAAIKNWDDTFKAHPPVRAMIRRHPAQAEKFERLLELGKALRGKLLPFGTARADWEYQIEDLGSNLQEGTFSNLMRGLGSWRTIMPAVASKTVAQVFVEHGASAWVLRTNQVGGNDPDIEPLAPFMS